MEPVIIKNTNEMDIFVYSLPTDYGRTDLYRIMLKTTRDNNCEYYILLFSDDVYVDRGYESHMIGQNYPLNSDDYLNDKDGELADVFSKVSQEYEPDTEEFIEDEDKDVVDKVYAIDPRYALHAIAVRTNGIYDIQYVMDALEKLSKCKDTTVIRACGFSDAFSLCEGEFGLDLSDLENLMLKRKPTKSIHYKIDLDEGCHQTAFDFFDSVMTM